ncbi:hypothetical protein HDU97_005579 [Phlyctochytrium planicorne]|nr:hypothetical protein HDU97_005579 [Phlyctochytrium planicorne]
MATLHAGTTMLRSPILSGMDDIEESSASPPSQDDDHHHDSPQQTASLHRESHAMFEAASSLHVNDSGLISEWDAEGGMNAAVSGLADLAMQGQPSHPPIIPSSSAKAASDSLPAMQIYHPLSPSPSVTPPTAIRSPMSDPSQTHPTSLQISSSHLREIKGAAGEVLEPIPVDDSADTDSEYPEDEAVPGKAIDMNGVRTSAPPPTPPNLASSAANGMDPANAGNHGSSSVMVLAAVAAAAAAHETEQDINLLDIIGINQSRDTSLKDLVYAAMRDALDEEKSGDGEAAGSAAQLSGLIRADADSKAERGRKRSRSALSGDAAGAAASIFKMDDVEGPRQGIPTVEVSMVDGEAKMASSLSLHHLRDRSTSLESNAAKSPISMNRVLYDEEEARSDDDDEEEDEHDDMDGMDVDSIYDKDEDHSNTGDAAVLASGQSAQGAGPVSSLGADSNVATNGNGATTSTYSKRVRKPRRHWPGDSSPDEGSGSGKKGSGSGNLGVKENQTRRGRGASLSALSAVTAALSSSHLKVSPRGRNRRASHGAAMVGRPLRDESIGSSPPATGRRGSRSVRGGSVGARMQQRGSSARSTVRDRKKGPVHDHDDDMLSSESLTSSEVDSEDMDVEEDNTVRQGKAAISLPRRLSKGTGSVANGGDSLLSSPSCGLEIVAAVAAAAAAAEYRNENGAGAGAGIPHYNGGGNPSIVVGSPPSNPTYYGSAPAALTGNGSRPMAPLYNYKIASALRYPPKTTSSAKPYVCTVPWCNKAYKKLNGLINHGLTAHPSGSATFIPSTSLSPPSMVPHPSMPVPAQMSLPPPVQSNHGNSASFPSTQGTQNLAPMPIGSPPQVHDGNGSVGAFPRIRDGTSPMPTHQPNGSGGVPIPILGRISIGGIEGVKMAFGDDEKPFVCTYDGCGKRYRNSNGLENGHKSHVSDRGSGVKSRDRRYSVSANGNRFESRDSIGTFKLDEEMEDVPKHRTDRDSNGVNRDGDDAEEKRFVCPFVGCGKAYKNKNGLVYHLEKGKAKQHHGMRLNSVFAAYVSSTSSSGQPTLEDILAALGSLAPSDFATFSSSEPVATPAPIARMSEIIDGVGKPPLLAAPAGGRGGVDVRYHPSGQLVGSGQGYPCLYKQAGDRGKR